MNPDYLSSHSLHTLLPHLTLRLSPVRESLVWMLLSQFDTWAKLMDTVTQTQKKGVVGPFFKVIVTKRAKPREG